jgi:O-methyltransferase
MNRIAKTINSISKRFGYRLIKIQKNKNWTEDFVGISQFEKKTLETCSNFSMTGFDRMFFLIKAIKQILINNVEGDFVECGVWKGGNLILFQKLIEKFNIKSKKIFAYDTFEGMTIPGDSDFSINNEKATNMMKNFKKKNNNFKCELDDVKYNYYKHTKKNNNLVLIKGNVEKTLKIKKNLPKKISILRLDTDWYKSTKIELETLFPLLSKNGILIIDDYGYWKGSRKAVDDYFKKKLVNLFKIDFTSRYLFKR